MPDKKSDEVPESTPENRDVLQNLFLGRKQPIGEHHNLDNWKILISLFGISTSSPGNPTVDPVPDPKPDPKPPTNDIEAAKRAAEAAQRAAESAKTQAEMARTGAESAKTAAETAKSQAEMARTGAESAKSQAETARTGAQTAQQAAEIAKIQAENALKKAELLQILIKMEEVFKFLKKHRFKLLLAAVGLIILSILLGSIFRRPKSLLPSNSTIYIDPVNGSDRNDGTNKAPFKTLPHALKQTDPGDTLHFLPGSYNRQDEPMVIPAQVEIAIHPNTSRRIFSDIQNHWAAEFIEALAVKGIIKGFKDGKFRPDAPLTRAQYAAIVSNAFNLPEPKNIKNFKDVKTDFWAYEAIQRTYSQQFLKGFPNNTFQPNEKVQRVQAIAALVSGSNLTSENDSKALSFYDDRNSIPDWAKPQVVTATAKQLIVNYPNLKRLKPTQRATRAEVAAMIYQSLVETQQIPPIQSIYIVPKDELKENRRGRG